jgi:hypothetical protein
MRRTRTLSGAVLTGALLTGALLSFAGSAVADSSTDPSPSPSASAADSPPTEAGTGFRTATVIQQGEQATASASAGDYLYWAFPADSGQNVTVKATVDFPSSAARHSTSTWQVDVYDGLRRRQPCRYGVQDRAAAADATSVQLSCTLRTVRAWAEPWSNDPLRGAYYIRLTVVDLDPADLGLPVQAAVEATSSGAGGSQAVDGSVTPLVPRAGADVEPTDGWSSTLWSDRWLWTAAGGVLAALAGVGGYHLARPRHTRRVTREVRVEH